MNDDAVEECHREFTVVLMGDINPDTKHCSLTPDIHRDPVMVPEKYMTTKMLIIVYLY